MLDLSVEAQKLQYIYMNTSLKRILNLSSWCKYVSKDEELTGFKLSLFLLLLLLSLLFLLFTFVFIVIFITI